jgi:hypothetical protein
MHGSEAVPNGSKGYANNSSEMAVSWQVKADFDRFGEEGHMGIAFLFCPPFFLFSATVVLLFFSFL